MEMFFNLMNGEHARAIIFSLRVIYFALFIVCGFSVIWRSRFAPRGRNRFALFALFFVFAFMGLLAYQARWQLFGARNTNLCRFIRRHNRRDGVDIQRGMILDRNGAVLACDDKERFPGARSYPLGYATAHSVGYFDVVYGMTGIERIADEELMGVEWTKQEELERIVGKPTGDTKLIVGRDLKLTLDARLQLNCFKLLEGKRGAIVVMDASSGELITLLSSPSFDPEYPGRFYGGPKEAPFLNRATQGRYPAGSTFKIVMAAMAADMNRAPIFNCPAQGVVAAKGVKAIRDSEYYSYKRRGAIWPGFGRMGLKKAFAHSSNTYFAQLGLDIPASSFNHYILFFGINDDCEIFRLGDKEIKCLKGSIPEVTDKDKAARAQLAIGQGRMLVSPLHVAMWTGVIAANGKRVVPHLDFRESVKEEEVIRPRTAEFVENMMREAVKSGTGKKIDIEGLGIAGKTGTAQNPSGKDHSWFTCFNTIGDRRYVVTVLIENGGFGSASALPVAKAVFEEMIKFSYFPHLKVNEEIEE